MVHKKHCLFLTVTQNKCTPPGKFKLAIPKKKELKMSYFFIVIQIRIFAHFF